MDRQATIGFILIGLILMAWLYWSTPETPPEPPKSKTDSTKTVKAVPDSLAKPKVDTTVKANEKTAELVSQFSADSTGEKTYTIETDLSIIDFSSKGGTIKRIYFKDYGNYYNDTLPATASTREKSVQLLDDKRGSGLRFEFMDQAGNRVSSEKINFSSNFENDTLKVTGKDSLVVEFTSKKILLVQAFPLNM
jgi:YidC/Oxa1 family membrane protein insertase